MSITGLNAKEGLMDVLPDSGGVSDGTVTTGKTTITIAPATGIIHRVDAMAITNNHATSAANFSIYKTNGTKDVLIFTTTIGAGVTTLVSLFSFRGITITSANYLKVVSSVAADVNGFNVSYSYLNKVGFSAPTETLA